MVIDTYFLLLVIVIFFMSRLYVKTGWLCHRIPQCKLKRGVVCNGE